MELLTPDYGLLLFNIIYLGVHLLLLVLFLRMLSGLLMAVSPENRRLQPGRVWLGLIPVFHLVWPLIMNPLVCLSVKKDMESKGKDEYGDYGMTLGIVYPLLALCIYVPYLGRFFAIAGMIVFFLFWVRMTEYKKRIIAAGGINPREDLLDH